MVDLLRRDISDVADDARQLLLELERDGQGPAAAGGECRPPVDVVEKPDAIEVVVDVPGIPPAALRVVIRRDTVLIVGAKGTPPPPGEARFHLAERSSGHFARAVRLSGAFDSSQARATLTAGQLRVRLPRIEDRRGRPFHVPVERG